MATEKVLPAIDEETKEMLDGQVKKGKARKFILIYKGAAIKTLIVFKKGPYGPKITAAKKAGFKGSAVCGVIVGKGVNLSLQVPGTAEVQQAMKAEGDICDSEPCKIAKLRKFFLEEAELKFKPEFVIVTDVGALASVSETDEEENDLEVGLTKDRLIDGLKKSTPFIQKAITLNGDRKSEVMEAAGKVKQLIQEGKFDEAQTALLELGGLLREIIKAAGPQPEGTSPTPPPPPEPSKDTALDKKQSEWKWRHERITPMLRAFLSYKLGDYGTIGTAFKSARDKHASATTAEEVQEAIDLLKQCAEMVETAERKFRNDYETVRDKNASRFDNAERFEETKDFVSSGRADAETMAGEFNYGAALGKLRELIEFIQTERGKIEQEFNDLYDEVIHEEIAFERDPNTSRGLLKQHLKNWDLAAAAAELKQFKIEIERSPRIGMGDLGTVEERSKQANLQNAQFSRNRAQAVNAAKRLIDEDGNLRVESDILDGLPFTKGNDLASLAEQIRESEHSDLPQSVHALEVLKRLQTDEKAREALSNVSAPTDQDSTAAKIIRSTLGLPKGTPVTDVEARQAALSALLFQARQGAVGSCFATATAVQIQRNNPETFLKDMQALFRDGKLTRTIEHNGSDYVIEVPLNTEMLVSTLEKKTTVPRQNGNLHLAPDMAASLDYLGINPNDREEAIKNAAQDLRAKKAIEAALKELDGWITPENKVKDVTEEALSVLRGNRSLSIRDCLKQAFDNLGIAGYASDGDWCARQLGHGDKDAFAVSEGYIDYADYQTQTGKNIQDVHAQSLGFSDASDRRLSIGLDKCTSFDDPTGSDSFSPQEVIAQAVANALPPDEREVAIRGAINAFLGQQDNRLMRAWEYTIGTMVERMPGKASNGDSMNAGIGLAGQAKVDELANNYIATNGPFTPGQENIIRQIARDVNDNFMEKLVTEIQTQYDPSVKTAKQTVAKDGHSSSGGYSLYHGDVRVDSEESFNTMLEDMMNKGLVDFNGGWNAGGRNLGQQFATDLLNHMKTKDFRDDCIAQNPHGDKNDLANPWTFASGGDTDTLLQLYHDQRNPLSKISTKSYTKTVEDGESLGEFLIDTLKNMQLGDKLAPDNSENAAIPVRAVGNHAFTLKPGNPALLTILKGEKTGTEVMTQFKALESEKNNKRMQNGFELTNPISKAIQSVLDQSTGWFNETNRGKIQQHVKQQLANLLNTGTETITIQQIQQLLEAGTEDCYSSSSEATRNARKKKSRELLASAVMSNVIPKEEFEPMIDTALDRLSVAEESRASVKEAILKELTGDTVLKDELDALVKKHLKEVGVEPTDKQLQLSLNHTRGIVVADMNWGDGDHMTLYSLVVNPLTDKVEMWRMNEDGSDPRPIDEDKWIKTSEWRVFTNTEAIGGVMGHDDIEKRRGELRGQHKECVTNRLGDLSMMQAVLEFADQKFTDGDLAAGGKALDRLESLIERAKKLADNRTEATTALGNFKAEVAKVAIDEAKDATAMIDLLIKEVGLIRNDNDVTDLVSRRGKELALVKQGQEPLGIAVDVETILNKA